MRYSYKPDELYFLRIGGSCGDDWRYKRGEGWVKVDISYTIYEWTLTFLEVFREHIASLSKFFLHLREKPEVAFLSGPVH